MRNFACTNCSNEVFFENVTCLECDHALGFDPVRCKMVALEAVDEAGFRAIGDGAPSGQDPDRLAHCDNRQHDV